MSWRSHTLHTHTPLTTLAARCLCRDLCHGTRLRVLRLFSSDSCRRLALCAPVARAERDLYSGSDDVSSHSDGIVLTSLSTHLVVDSVMILR